MVRLFGDSDAQEGAGQKARLTAPGATSLQAECPCRVASRLRRRERMGPRHRRFLPVTDEVIRWHLSGRDASDQPFVAGVYPLLLDETCFFLSVDFDKEGWQADSIAFLRGCRRLGLTPALERSRSGRGGHAWLFFEEAIPAALARRLGSHLLTETMEDRPDIGLDSYDRLFPNQDTIPQGGFGNLIALPLQRGPRDQGNSVFVDDDLVPWADQWAFLAGVRRIGRTEAESIVQEAERRGRVLGVRLPPQDDGDVEPWTAARSRRRQEAPMVGECPATMELVYANQIYIAKEGLLLGLRNRLLRIAAFQNPEFYKAQAMRLSTYGKPRVVACAEDHPQHIGMPRGCLDDMRQELASLGMRVVVRDEREPGCPLDVRFTGELRSEQLAAAEAMVSHDTGVLAATTAFGKTVIALDVPRPPSEVDRPCGRRADPRDGPARCRPHSEPRQEGRRPRPRRRLRPRHR